MRCLMRSRALEAWLLCAACLRCLGQSCQMDKILGFQASATSDQDPLAVTCPAVIHGCTLTDSASVVLTAHISRTSATPLTVAWSINNNVVDTQSLPDTTPLEADVSTTQTLALGSYTAVVTVNDGTNTPVQCQSTVDVMVDQGAPQVTCSV